MSRLRNRLVYIALVVIFLAAAVLIRSFDPFLVPRPEVVAFDHYQQLDPGAYDPDLPVRGRYR